MMPVRRRILPGFGLTMGVTVVYLSLIVLLPLALAFGNVLEMGWAELWEAVTHPRVLAAYRVSFGLSLLAGLLNAVLGLITSWVLARYRFPGKSVVDALVDLPFALPTAVAGIALTAIFGPTGWLGAVVEPFGLRLAFNEIGVLIALTFVGLPFVVRTLQPVIGELEAELEEAAASMGASRLQTLRLVVIPELLPPLITGFTLAFARALGEYGSVVFISGNIPERTEIVPLLIVTRLEQYDYPGATALAVTMLLASFALLLAINTLQKWSNWRTRN